MVLIRPPKGFTLVEILLAILLAAMVMVSIFSFFGESMQKFVQHEDTLTGVRDLQLMLGYLRRDISMLDGSPGLNSSSSHTGTTYPKQYIHLCHSARSDVVKHFGFMRLDEGTPYPTTDPFTENMPLNRRTERLVDSLAYCENACAFVVPDSSLPKEEQVSFLVLNVRRGGVRERVIYTYSGKTLSLTRQVTGTSKKSVFATGSLTGFVARPIFDMLTFPGQVDKTAELCKFFIELSFTIKASADGGKIDKRELTFTTKVTPKLLNYACKSRWSN